MDTIFKRTSVRRFNEKNVSDEIIDQVLRAAMQAPSAGNQQPWEFIIVRERVALDDLAKMSAYAKPIANAQVAIVVLGNEGYMRYPENWEQDLGACVQNILLQVTDLGLGAVWIGVAPLKDRMEHVASCLALPHDIKPYCVIPIGYSDDEVRIQDRYDSSRVYKEIYGCR